MSTCWRQKQPESPKPLSGIFGKDANLIPDPRARSRKPKAGFLLHSIAIKTSIHLADHSLYVERDLQKSRYLIGDRLRLAQHAMIVHAAHLDIRLRSEEHTSELQSLRH